MTSSTATPESHLCRVDVVAGLPGVVFNPHVILVVGLCYDAAMRFTMPGDHGDRSRRYGLPTFLVLVAAQPAHASFNGSLGGLLAEFAVGFIVYVVLMATWFTIAWGIIELALSGPLRTSTIAPRRFRRISMVVAGIVWFMWSSSSRINEKTKGCSGRISCIPRGIGTSITPFERSLASQGSYQRSRWPGFRDLSVIDPRESRRQ